MNSILSLNKNFVLYLIFLIFILFCFFFSFKFYNKLKNDFTEKQIEISNVDITEPKFAINSLSQKITITAREGNFIDNDKILLQKNVMFESDKFKIKTDKVTFNRREQTAESNNKSIFTSNKTIISSEGFNIYDNGNKIQFYGKSKVILK